jgi:hypothetical protein
MSKRFIDTGIFDDDWFMDLSKDEKLLWLYFITKCDHAGILKLNEKLCKVQTDIKDLSGTIKQLGNRLVTVSEHLYFIPKFIEFQYPGFPNSKVRQQQSAVDILVKHGLFDKENLTVSKELGNSYEHVIVNDTVIVNGNEPVKKGSFDFSFIDPKFKESFDLWVKYKKSRNEMYKNQDSLEACYRNLLKLSMEDSVKAKLVIDQAMGNNYAGLFPLKLQQGQPVQSEEKKPPKVPRADVERAIREGRIKIGQIPEEQIKD